MAKVAFLIGVSEYQGNLTPLPAAAKDVEAMKQVLQHPEIGGFDQVHTLLNPEPVAMQQAIEDLFTNCHKDDLLLLFFSGHGIKDQQGKLYFSTPITKKNPDGNLAKASAVPASFVHDIMSNSLSKRQVVILDCCFSGAFAEGMPARNNDFVDIKNQLGGEGRAVLTSSTSTQYSFDNTYTRYIVEGLNTGAADRDEDGWISVDELHEYAKEKVKESVPAMKPEIYAIKEGYKIQLAKAPIDDPNLKYRQEVEYWSKQGGGEITPLGRATLDLRRDSLKLTTDWAAKIEAEVLEPYRIYKEKLQQYENVFRQVIQREFPISDNTRANLKRLQHVLGLRDEDVALIENNILTQRNRSRNNLSPFKLVVGGLVALIAGITLVTQWINQPSLEREISLGEDILFEQASSDKEKGVKAFARNDFNNAINYFKSSLSKHPDDPEALIYKNNAEAAKTSSDLKIAVSIPIRTNLNVAAEILRGVAQAQNELNQKGGINGKKLWVAIANDNNNPEDAKNIATEFVKNPKYSSVLAVVGHNSSEASLVAREEYEPGKLVMISPTNDADTLPNDPPIFHTMPTLKTVVKALSEHAKKAGVTKIAICYDSKAKASESFKNKFVDAFGNAGVVPTDCDLSKINTDSINTILGDAKKRQANGILLLPGVRSTIDEAIKIAAAAKKQNFKLLGSSTINTYQTLDQGQDIKGMVVAVPWNPTAGRGKSFAMQATQLWGKNVDWRTGNLTWRTAMAYDTTQAIIQGIKTWEQEKDKPPREWLTNKLATKDFSVDGVTGKVHFQGDRNGEVSLVQLKQINIIVTGYDYVPFPLPN